MAAKVVGLDLSITSPGVCHPSGAAWAMKTKQADGDIRLQKIRSAVLDAAFECDLAVIEGWIVRSSAGPVMGMVHGAVRTMLMDHQIPYLVVTPATLKKFATGSGTADKTRMALAAYKRAGIEFPGDKGGDACDAWWLRVAGLYLLGEPPFDLPALQVGALSALELPQACRTVKAVAA